VSSANITYRSENAGSFLEDGQAVPNGHPRTIGTNGRGTGSLKGTVNGATVTSANYDFYFVTTDRFILITGDNSVVLSGVAERQCSDCQF